MRVFMWTMDGPKEDLMSGHASAHIRDLAGVPLRWTQPHALTQEFELLAGGVVGATLTFRGMFGSQATGRSRDGCWTFKRLGFIATRVSIRVCETEADLAVFRNSTWSGGGTLELPDGRKCPANCNFWQTRYEIRTESDSPLVTFSRVGGLFHLSSDVEIHPDAVAWPELPWLVMLGWYLTVMQHRDAAVAVVG
jgi:hypothetical protein